MQGKSGNQAFAIIVLVMPSNDLSAAEYIILIKQSRHL